VRGPTATALYCYGVVAGPRAPSLGGAPSGLPGLGRLRALPVDDSLWLLAADAPLARFGAEAINRGLRDLEWVSTCAMAHEAVVEHVGRSATIVPMKLFTLFTSDARAVDHIRRSGARLTRILRRVAGRQEWGVRVSLDEARALTIARAAARTGAGPRRGAGTRFLLRKGAERAGARRLVSGARGEAARVLRALRARAEAARRRGPVAGPDGARLVLDAAFLVPRERGRAFRAEVRRIARRLGPRGYRVTLTGPWPPYNFVGGGR
jgi:hypothetical protein